MDEILNQTTMSNETAIKSLTRTEAFQLIQVANNNTGWSTLDGKEIVVKEFVYPYGFNNFSHYEFTLNNIKYSFK